jgi:drug/metabolite transporter (DMT)-like permease
LVDYHLILFVNNYGFWGFKLKKYFILLRIKLLGNYKLDVEFYTFALMQSLTKNKNFLLVGILISMLIWGVSWPLAKLLMHYGKPLEIAIIRFFFTFLSMLIILKVGKVSYSVSKKGWTSLLLASMLLGLYNFTFFNGIKFGMPGAGGVLGTTLTPIITFIIGLIITKKVLQKNEILGLILGLIAGIFLLKLWVNYDHLLDNGNAFFLASAVIWASLSRVTSTAKGFGSPLAFSLWIYLGAIIVLSFFVDFSSIIHILSTADMHFWFLMLFMAVINTGMATTFYIYATSIIGAEKTNSFIFVVPFCAAVCSYFIVDEIIQWNTIVGGILGILAVWIINKKVL